MSQALDALITKLEAASEGSRELDWHIAGCPVWVASGLLGGHPNFNNPPYTTSVDAALTLVPDGCAVDIHVGPHDISSCATVFVPRKSLDDQGRRVTSYEPHEAPSIDGTIKRQPAAVAICITALRGRSTTGGGDDD